MTRDAIVPCLWFDDQAEPAARFYTRTFPEGRITALSRYPESRDNPSHKPRGSVLTIELDIAGQRFTALNGGPQFSIGPSLSFFVHVDSASDADRLFATLVEGGKAWMPIGAYPWSDRYGWAQDRFGVSWQVIAGRREPEQATIVPCLMFAGRQHGRAESAMGVYTALFPGSRIDRVERYAAGEGPEGLVKHGRFQLAGQHFVAMDSHVAHDIAFDEAVSLQVMCRDQDEVDRYWAALSEGGEPGACGWLKDRFGLSWQVVPKGLVGFLTSEDSAARDRAFDAMMGMKKPIVAVLESAFAGKS